jgi:hypothetical protein
MKEILNEWRKFLNENEGEDYYIRTWTAISSEDPAKKQRYSVKMSNGEEFVAEFGKDLVVKSESGAPAREGISDMVVRFIIEDLPYEWGGRAQEEDPKGFEAAMKMIDSLYPRYLDIRKKEDEREAGDAGKQISLPNVNEGDLDERCQKGYKTHPTRKTKKMYGKTYRNCVKAEE